MSNSECVSCRKSKANLVCEMCEESVCKNCVQVLDVDTFSFLAKIPKELIHSNYCGACYDMTVTPELERYNEIMERAINVFVFFQTQRKEIPLIRKSKEVFSVTNCIDRDQTILRLAFFAAEQGFNAVIDVEELFDKIRNGRYQTSVWRGTGIAAQIDEGKLERQDLRNQVYR